MRRVAIKLMVDYVFKWLFGVDQHERFLLALLNAILAATLIRPLVAIHILNPFDERSFEDGKLSILDIRAVDDQGRIYNIEMQLNDFTYYLSRALYYWAGAYHGQLSEGDSYAKLQPTIGIHFVNGNLFKDSTKYHQVFDLRERTDPAMVFSDQLQLHFIELPKFVADVDSLKTPLDQWLYVFKHGEDLDLDRLPASLKTPIMTEALEVLWNMSNSPQQRIFYESRLKAKRDYEAGLAYAKEQGEKRGIEIGEQIGMEKGIEKGIEKGERLGIEKGERAGILMAIRSGLRSKFGAAGHALFALVESEILPSQLEKRLEEMFAADSVHELEAIWRKS